jgi:hypothetical protein
VSLNFTQPAIFSHKSHAGTLYLMALLSGRLKSPKELFNRFMACRDESESVLQTRGDRVVFIRDTRGISTN